MIIFKTKTQAKKLHLSTFYLQTILYFDRIYSYFLFIFELAIFAYKGNKLYMPSIAGEVIFVFAFALVHFFKLWLVDSANKSQSVIKLIFAFLITILEVGAFIFFLMFQAYTLNLEISIFGIGLAITIIEIIFLFPIMLIYKANS